MLDVDDSARVSIYAAPHPGTVLHALGSACLGRDAEHGTGVVHPAVEELSADDWLGISAAPRVYGFHATLKPPFRFAAGTDRRGLLRAVTTLADAVAPVVAPPLVVATLGNFVALVPSAPAPELCALAAHCVRALDRFRAPPTPEELARRRKAGLTSRQQALLSTWGYPYVLDEFRFHMTLSGRLAPYRLPIVSSVLGRLAAPLAETPLVVDDLCVFEQTCPSAPFLLTTRVPLRGGVRA